MDSAISDGGDASTSSGGSGGGQLAVPATPMPISTMQGNAPPPFLSKTYDMVDDPSSDAIVSWSSTNNSFVVWNPPEFARDLLPKYFKHNNFSSFVRQLNTYGFRKVDPDRWEFANEGFLRGQKHLLKSISRRKPVHGHAHQQTQQPPGQSSSVGACVEVGKFGLEEEVERLKRDKNVLMQELVRLRQQQQATDGQLQGMVQRLQGMEQRQQQMMSFLAKAMQSPGFLTQFVQQQNESNRRITEANKKRRLKRDGVSENESSSAPPDGQIVKYQPQMNDAAKAMLRQIMKMDAPSTSESYNNGLEGFLIGDGSPISSGMENGSSSSSQVSGVTLLEVPPTSGQSTYLSSSEMKSDNLTASQFPDFSALVGSNEAPSISIPQSDVVMPPLSQIPDIIPESIVGEGFMQPETGNDEFMDLSSLGIDNSDPDIDLLLENPSFWDTLVQSPAPEDIESSSIDGKANENDAQPMDNNGWDKEHMDELTEQMELLTSETKKL
ncbi:heat shock factor protein HSF8 [Mercurialis annua]|uniref:heat shock factor protein HSF8 n=1 Tax=Mercurialis annua TaxID=3986 RepID=UPI00215E9C06|nr:heat shock factor protein HSF8 [Mercurialis annua]